MNYFSGATTSNKAGFSNKQLSDILSIVGKNIDDQEWEEDKVITPFGIVADFSGTMHKYSGMTRHILYKLSEGLAVVDGRDFFINLVCIYNDEIKHIFFGSQQEFYTFMSKKDNGIPEEGWGRTPLAEAVKLSTSINKQVADFFKDRKLPYTIPVFFTITDSIETESHEVEEVVRELRRKTDKDECIVIELAAEPQFKTEKSVKGLNTTKFVLPINIDRQEETDDVVASMIEALKTGSSFSSKKNTSIKKNIPDPVKDLEAFKDYHSRALCTNIRIEWDRLIL